MNYLETVLERNKEFATQQFAAATLLPSLSRALPNVKAVIIGCADMRADPAHVLGIRPGEAVVMRNISESRPGCCSSCGHWGESVKLPVRFPEPAESFTSSFFSTPIAASLALRASLACWRSIFRFGKRISGQKPWPIPNSPE